MRTKIGIIGSGNVGAAMGRLWGLAGHDVVFSFSRDPSKLEEAAKAAGAKARAGTPAEAAAQQIVVLAVPWPAVSDALKAAGTLDGRILLSTVNPLKSDLSGLSVGTTTSGAEEIAKLVPKARLVACIPPFATLLASASRRIQGERAAAFFASNDAEAKAMTMELVQELDVSAVDAGPLYAARFIEPAGMLIVHLAYGIGLGGGNLGWKVLGAGP